MPKYENNQDTYLQFYTLSLLQKENVAQLKSWNIR